MSQDFARLEHGWDYPHVSDFSTISFLMLCNIEIAYFAARTRVLVSVWFGFIILPK